jgi:hypothetical protein
VPFLITLLGIIVQEVSTNAILVLALGLLLLIIYALYQLYIWSLSFFYSQRISEGDWGQPDLTIADLGGDFRIKLKLFAIRVIWHAPLLLIYGAIALPSFLSILNQANSNSLSGFDSPEWIKFIVSTLSYLLIQIVVEHVFVNITSYIYSETNSLVKGFNPILILRILSKTFFLYLIVVGLAILGNFVSGLIGIPLQGLLAIPLLGALLSGFILGIISMYQYLFLANLQGQIWQHINQEKIIK